MEELQDIAGLARHIWIAQATDSVIEVMGIIIAEALIQSKERSSIDMTILCTFVER